MTPSGASFPQEVEPRCGEALCRLFVPDDNVDLRAIAMKAKRARREAHAERGGGGGGGPGPAAMAPPPEAVFSPRDSYRGGGGGGGGGPPRLGLFIGLAYSSCAGDGRSVT